MSLQIVTTPELEIAYAESGPSSGPVVILLHGWPDSIDTWAPTVAELSSRGFRCLTPFLRGFGATRFLNTSTLRSGQATALASDLIAFADALGIQRFNAVGHDWGAFTVYLAAAIWPERISRVVALSVAYGINRPDGLPKLPQAKAFWYQWLFQTPQGERLLTQDPRAFGRYIWESWMPTHDIKEPQFLEAAQAWENADWAEVTLHYYRHRWGSVPGDPQYDELEKSRLNPPVISVPTRLIHGEEDPCILAETTLNKESHFSGTYERVLLPGVGHFPQREAPQQTTQLIAEFVGGAFHPKD